MDDEEQMDDEEPIDDQNDGRKIDDDDDDDDDVRYRLKKSNFITKINEKVRIKKKEKICHLDQSPTEKFIFYLKIKKREFDRNFLGGYLYTTAKLYGSSMLVSISERDRDSTKSFPV